MAEDEERAGVAAVLEGVGGGAPLAFRSFGAAAAALIGVEGFVCHRGTSGGDYRGRGEGGEGALGGAGRGSGLG